MSTRPPSIAMRAACRNSSRRCAETTTLASTIAISADGISAALLARKLCSVIVRRVAVNRVYVIDAALRRIFDHQRRPLHAEVRGTAVRRRSAPREIGVADVGADLRHARLGKGVIHDARP